MHWGWYLESPRNPWLPGLLSQSCSSALSPHISCSMCAKRCNILTGKACCHHAYPLVICCNKTCHGIRYEAHTFHFMMPLSFISIQRNPNIPLKNVKKYVFLHSSCNAVSVCTLLTSQVWMHTSTRSLFHVTMKTSACCYPHPLNHMPTVCVMPPVISGIYSLSINILGLKVQRPGIEDSSQEQQGFLCTNVDGKCWIKTLGHDTASTEVTVELSTVSLWQSSVPGINYFLYKCLEVLYRKHKLCLAWTLQWTWF